MDPADNPPGDTQVVSQSVYDSIIRQNGESLLHLQNGANGATLMTLHEGDSGHIDLLAEFDSARQQKELSPNHDEESDYDPSDSSPTAATEYQPEFFPESQRFLAETPGTAVKMNQTPRTSMKTPSLPRNPLAGEIESSGGLLGLSQIFKATQAPSSPLVHGQQSELVSDRPSPNIPIQPTRMNHNVSSPFAHSRALFTGESSEPNLNYISLKESQLRRDKTLGERLTRSADNRQSIDEADEEFYKLSSFVENARRKRERKAETAAQFAALSAAPRSTTNTATSIEQPIQEVHNDDEMPAVAGSEEETEQEEEPGPQVPQSQELPQSSEEDKENYNGPPEPVVGTNSAHDRLSQALALEQSPSVNRTPMLGPGAGRTRQDSADLSGREYYTGRSSQVMVKDSQQSPQPSPTPRSNAQDTVVQSHLDQLHPEAASDREETSPVRRMQSSPPGSSHGEHQPPRSNTTSPVTAPFPKLPVFQPSQANLLRDNRAAQSNNPFMAQISRPSPNKCGTGTDAKPSISYHVTGTPVHLRPQVSEMARQSTIPETSPGHENEDDGLPPMFPAGRISRSSQSPGCPQVLSSPSGRQRRRLTDIASDVSPQVDTRFHDLGMSLFMPDDEEFHSLVIDGSPTGPRKKRRGNAGQNLHMSDTNLAATPRAQPPKTAARIPKWPSPEKPQSPATIHVPETAVRKTARPPRSTEDIWDVGGSPQQVIRTRSRSRHSRSKPPQTSQQRIPLRSPGPEAPARPAVIHNLQPSPSSELTNVDILNSEDLPQSESLTEKSPPTTPKAARVASGMLEIAPRQVLAVWMGQKRAYYPATCFGTPLGGSESKYSVKFEDSLPVEVVKGAVKRLELRVGDLVKVDLPGVPKVTHTVRGVDDPLTCEDLARAAQNGVYPPTDIYGNTSVILGPKQSKSLPGAGLASSENVIKVPMSRIYLDTLLWNKFKDRPFTYQPESAPREIKPHTPSEKSELMEEPKSNERVNPTELVPACSVYDSGGIFAGMAFAVSYKEDEATKNRIARLITEHGGTLLDEGFTKLFDSSSVCAVSTPTKGREDVDLSKVRLRLNCLATNIGFACLIADTHSRREKYMQALALNLPCLSGRWVEDCIAKGRVLDWDIYLLPAGESMYLNGVTKSRVMVPTPPSQARLADTIDARPKLLEGKSVLIVMGRGKAEEKRKAYVFLTIALGAARVQRVPDLETAKALIDSQSEASLPCGWDFIYVDDADQASAKALLTPQPRTQMIHFVHRKRRRKSISMSTPPNEAVRSGKVVGSEFICQSLILGRLFEE